MQPAPLDHTAGTSSDLGVTLWLTLTLALTLTLTVTGTASDPGVTPRVATEIFDVLKNFDGMGTWHVYASYLQIYREVRVEGEG